MDDFSLDICINPVVWFMCREIDNIAELSCDEKVISTMNIEEKQCYGDMLIAIAAKIKPFSAMLSTTLCEDKIVLKERLTLIMKSKKQTKAGVAVSTAVLLGTICAVCVLGAANESDSSLFPNSNPKTLRESEYYYVAIDDYGIRIQANDDLDFIPPSKVIFSFIGTEDEIKKWKKTVERNDESLPVPKSYIDPEETLLLIDSYDKKGNLTASILAHAPTSSFELVYDSKTDAYKPSSILDHQISNVRFIGTHKELWELDITKNIEKPMDMFPNLFISGDKLLSGYHPLTQLSDDWNLDTITSAKFALFGTIAEIMDFWGYTEAEVKELLIHSSPSVPNQDFYDSLSADDNNNSFAVIEFFDDSLNVAGRHFIHVFADPPIDPKDTAINEQVLFFKTYDEYEKWSLMQ